MGSGCQKDEQTLPEIKEIPQDYIQSEDDVVDIQGEMTNLEVFYSFLNRVKQGQKSEIRVVTHTTEGAPMLHDLVFDGENIQSTYDSTRDGFGYGSIEQSTCERVVEKVLGDQTEYVLEGCNNGDGEKTVLLVEKK
nr:DUF4362 domain-containing protein [Bacillus sp. ISL-35]